MPPPFFSLLSHSPSRGLHPFGTSPLFFISLDEVTSTLPYPFIFARSYISVLIPDVITADAPGSVRCSRTRGILVRVAYSLEAPVPRNVPRKLTRVKISWPVTLTSCNRVEDTTYDSPVGYTEVGLQSEPWNEGWQERISLNDDVEVVPAKTINEWPRYRQANL